MYKLISLSNVGVEFGDKTVLKNVTFDVFENDKIGIVGKNGAGKTTLIKAILAAISPTSGSINVMADKLIIGYLKQITDYNNINTDTEIIQESISNFYQTTSEIKVGEKVNVDFEQLSGGEKTKIALAKVLCKNPNLLILDEPTNHLDFDGINWLIDTLKAYNGTLLVISHDRFFLDKVTNKTIEVDRGEVKVFQGNYSAYKDQKQHQTLENWNCYSKQEKKKKEINMEINRLKNWSNTSWRKAGKQSDMRGTKAHYRKSAKKIDDRVKSKIKKLEKIDLEGVEKPWEEGQIKFDFAADFKKNKRILEVSNLSKGYSGADLFKNNSFYLNRGEKVALIGPNGCGKTTLLKLINQTEQPDIGTIWISPSATFSYLSQDVTDLEENITPLEYLNAKSGRRRSIAQTTLANLGVDSAAVTNQIKNLSMGERTKVKLVNIILNSCDFLILDEPTNHLDIANKEQLEQALKDFEGTLILVSHDRYLVENTCDIALEIKDNKIIKNLSPWKSQTKLSQQQMDKTLLETKISEVLSKLSDSLPDSEEYQQLDLQFKELVKLRNN
ncbi:ABC-F type ribosomal protection protein [Proteinivorax hydrogeniformans]|uniref:ABC-F type ribosomal protection protein n=1 Tax=Proteinivorax hydrogeniformans TaxID=1826727 RepID=A0AAU8HR38_9FIRM